MQGKICRWCRRSYQGISSNGFCKRPLCIKNRALQLELFPELPTTKLCLKCREEKPLEAFPGCSKYPTERHSYCRECNNEIRRVKNLATKGQEV